MPVALVDRLFFADVVWSVHSLGQAKPRYIGGPYVDCAIHSRPSGRFFNLLTNGTTCLCQVLRLTAMHVVGLI